MNSSGSTLSRCAGWAVGAGWPATAAPAAKGTPTGACGWSSEGSGALSVANVISAALLSSSNLGSTVLLAHCLPPGRVAPEVLQGAVAEVGAPL
eukprot:scaffold86248_cov57-Phaeocystis_antarctica.AAC.2